MKRLASVLIPVYGDAEYLDETLESIKRNVTSVGEVLIVDDGLSNSGKSTIRKHEKVIPIQIEKSHGRGLVDALNTGLNLAKFDYICRIDSDDIMMENRITNQLEYLQSHHDVVAVGSQCAYIDQDGNAKGISNYPIGYLNDLEDFYIRCLIAHPSTMFLRDAALSIGGYRSLFTWNGVDIAEDFDFWLRLSRVGGIVVTDQILTKYRQHSKQLSSTNILGQLVGTPYISAVNIEGDLNPRVITFSYSRSQDEKYFLKKISRTFGMKKRIAVRLLLLESRNSILLRGQFFSRFVMRVINFLNR
jgi:glycosyltransferase involved in cell wall biosynthesis